MGAGGSRNYVTTYLLLRRDVISAAHGKRSRLPWGVAIGDNKNTAYFHPLFIYNQRVIA